jgi:hypothetical protein
VVFVDVAQQGPQLAKAFAAICDVAFVHTFVIDMRLEMADVVFHVVTNRIA